MKLGIILTALSGLWLFMVLFATQFTLSRMTGSAYGLSYNKLEGEPYYIGARVVNSIQEPLVYSLFWLTIGLLIIIILLTVKVMRLNRVIDGEQSSAQQGNSAGTP